MQPRMNRRMSIGGVRLWLEVDGTMCFNRRTSKYVEEEYELSPHGAKTMGGTRNISFHPMVRAGPLVSNQMRGCRWCIHASTCTLKGRVRANRTPS